MDEQLVILLETPKLLAIRRQIISYHRPHLHRPIVNRAGKLRAIGGARFPGQIFDQWGSSGSGDGQLNGPGGIAVDSAGNIYVADTGNNRVQKFGKSGQFLTKWGSIGSANGQFHRPEGIAVDSNGNVFVADADNHRVQVFNFK